MISLFCWTVHVSACQNPYSRYLFLTQCLFPCVYKAHYVAAACWMSAPSPTKFSSIGHSGCHILAAVSWATKSLISHSGLHAVLTLWFHILPLLSVLSGFFSRLSVVHPQCTHSYHPCKGTISGLGSHVTVNVRLLFILTHTCLCLWTFIYYFSF